MEMDIDSTTCNPKGEEQKGKPVIVILVGAPGSGKSTFCEQVMGSSSSRTWTRICQDAINNGKAGTKQQCLKSAAISLKEGKSVFIDRCNLDKDQRLDFVKLGGVEVDVHAVVLDLPAQVCISRSVKRTAHEGNLQGGKAAAVVNRMLQKKELPKLNEGFSRIEFCYNESDIQAAVKTYSALGPLDSLPNGCYGQKNPDAKIQLGIMKFLKKVEVPSNVVSNSDGAQDSTLPLVGNDNDARCKGPDKGSLISVTASTKVKESEDRPKSCIGNNISVDNIPALAFPSISTADFQFDNEKASDIIVDKVQEFVNKLENGRLVLVDLSHGSKILSLVRAKAAQRNIDSKKFFTFVGDITQLYSRGGLRCNVIANAANWRLKPGGGGVNAAIFGSAGPALEIATKERAKCLLPGHAVVVPLPSDSPLHSREGVSHVIHVLGPNMNPKRPNFLDNDYTKGCEILCEAYTSLFDGFLSIVTHSKLPRSSNENLLPSDLIDSSLGGQGNHLMSSDQNIKRDGDWASNRGKKCKGSHDEIGTGITGSSSTCGNTSSKVKGNTSKGWGSWAQPLYHTAMHPEKHKDEVLEILDDVVVLNDVYPKAQRHLLVLARYEGLDCLTDARQEHLQLLMTVHDVGLKWAEKFLQEDSSMAFRLGYHSVPSMRQLHMHVISQDFNSNHLKNKRHWNSFNTAFFRDSVDVIEEIKNHGKATVKGEDSRLSIELRCHRCRSAHPNIPKLKSHISICKAPFPPALHESGRLVLRPQARNDP